MSWISKAVTAVKKVGVAVDSLGLTKAAATAVGAGGAYDALAKVNSARKSAAKAGVTATDPAASSSPTQPEASASKPPLSSRISSFLTKPAVIVTGLASAAGLLVLLIFRRGRR